MKMNKAFQAALSALRVGDVMIGNKMFIIKMLHK